LAEGTVEPLAGLGDQLRNVGALPHLNAGNGAVVETGVAAVVVLDREGAPVVAANVHVQAGGAVEHVGALPQLPELAGFKVAAVVGVRAKIYRRGFSLDGTHKLVLGGKALHGFM
jgi:hypothetical protein